jgi:zinc D-Ala-D-Ala carboxypeptidase
MKRRDFLQIASITSLSGLSGCSTLSHLCQSCFPILKEEVSDLGEVYSNHQHEPLSVPLDQADDLRARSDYFDREFPSDILAKGDEFKLLVRLAQKFDKIQSYVGHGNFNILSYNDAVYFSSVVSSIEPFSPEEKRWLEKLFYNDAKIYGFMGEKIFRELDSDEIKKNNVIKVPYTGHFLLKGPSYETYQRLTEDVGEGLILTSGVRSLAKQFHLFLEKARETKGNLSRASRSLAPPGYSFHGRGDFDVGQIGGGLMNFTDQFSETPEFKRLIELGYIDIRYEQSNLLGVRFEPWHIKVEA